MNICCCSLPSTNPEACDNCLNNPNRFKFNNPTIYSDFRYMNPVEEKCFEDVMDEICKNGIKLDLKRANFDELD